MKTQEQSKRRKDKNQDGRKSRNRYQQRMKKKTKKKEQDSAIMPNKYHTQIAELAKTMTQNRGEQLGKIDYLLITYEEKKVGDKYGGDGVSDPRPHNPVADQQAGQQEKQVLRIHVLCTTTTRFYFTENNKELLLAFSLIPDLF
jgi:hypothetical protein